MKKSNLLKIIIQIILSAFITALIALFFLPDFNKKYRAELSDLYSEVNMVSTYFDMNNDMTNERITLINIVSSPGVIIREYPDRIINQWNPQPGFFGSSGCADYDRDEIYEFYYIFYSGDSITINQIRPFAQDYKIIRNIYLGETKMHNDVTERPDMFSGSFDLNNDGYEEIVFALCAGFSRSPRRIIAWDLHNDTIYMSRNSGTAIYYPELFDLNGDGYYEIFGQTYAFNNFEDDTSNTPFKDTKDWLMVLDHNLNFLFEPVPLGSASSIVNIQPYISSKDTNLLAFHSYHADNQDSSRLILYDLDGTVLKENPLPSRSFYEGSWLLSRLDQDKVSQAMIIRVDKKVETYDTNLKNINEIKIKRLLDGRPLILDVDEDGVEEYIFRSAIIGELFIYRNDFTGPIKLEMPNPGRIDDISLYKIKGESPQLSVHYNNQQAFYTYGLNKMYYLRFLIYLVVFAFIFYIVWLGYYMKKVKLVSSSKIKELEVKSISNQMESHFTLNTLNAIGSLYAQDDKEKADYYFGKYAKLVRNTLIHSDQIAQSLDQELDYVKNYLDIQKFRLNERFDYRISMGKSVELGINVPKMILFTFVENAIKHGLKNKQGKGHLEIIIENTESRYKFVIEDNGIGREMAGKLSDSGTGKGMKILEEILELYYQETGEKVKYQIEDLTNESGIASGTRVTVTL